MKPFKEARFKIVGDIKTKQRPRFNGKTGHTYTPKDTLYYENYIKSEYQRQCPNVWFGDEPIVASIICHFKPNSELYDLLNYFEWNYPVQCTNPKDCDNLAKTILDALNSIAFNDDRQVVSLMASKMWSQEEQEYVEVILRNCDYMTIDELKHIMKMNKLYIRKQELEAKDKLTSAEKKRLEEIKNTLKIEELGDA